MAESRQKIGQLKARVVESCNNEEFKRLIYPQKFRQLLEYLISDVSAIEGLITGNRTINLFSIEQNVQELKDYINKSYENKDNDHLLRLEKRVDIFLETIYQLKNQGKLKISHGKNLSEQENLDTALQELTNAYRLQNRVSSAVGSLPDLSSPKLPPTAIISPDSDPKFCS